MDRPSPAPTDFLAAAAAVVILGPVHRSDARATPARRTPTSLASSAASPAWVECR